MSDGNRVSRPGATSGFTAKPKIARIRFSASSLA